MGRAKICRVFLSVPMPLTAKVRPSVQNMGAVQFSKTFNASAEGKASRIKCGSERFPHIPNQSVNLSHHDFCFQVIGFSLNATVCPSGEIVATAMRPFEFHRNFCVFPVVKSQVKTDCK